LAVIGSAAAIGRRRGRLAGRTQLRIININTEKTWRGGESQTFNLMRGLRAGGHDVSAAVMPGGALARRCRDEGIPILELSMRSDADVPAAWRLAGQARSARCDILHAQTARAHAIGLLARLCGAPGRLVVHRRLDFPIARNPLDRLKYRSRRVDAWIAVAEVVRGVLIAGGVEPGRISVINSSIDLGRFTGVPDQRRAVRAELGIPQDAWLVGNVAALAWHKGQKDLLAAMPHLLKRVPSAWLVMVGGGEERTALEALARALGVESRVIFTGVRQDVPRLLTALDAFCMSSLLEGLCNSVLEAFAMQVPVVATRAGGLPELVEDGRTGLLVPPRDAQALAEALSRQHDDPAAARRMAGAARDLVHARFGVDYMVARTAELYARLLRTQAPLPPGNIPRT